MLPHQGAHNPEREADKQANGLNIRVEIEVFISAGRAHGQTVALAWGGQEKLQRERNIWVGL